MRCEGRVNQTPMSAALSQSRLRAIVLRNDSHRNERTDEFDHCRASASDVLNDIHVIANEEDKDERSGWSTCESGLDSCGCSQGDPRAGRGAGGQVMMEVESGQSARKGPVTGERIGRTMTPQSAQVHARLARYRIDCCSTRRTVGAL